LASVARKGVTRSALNDVNDRCGSAYTNGMKALEANTQWQSLDDADRKRILAEVHLHSPVREDIGTDDTLLAALDTQNLSARAAESDAVTGRVQHALEIAARRLEPKIRTVTLERATLRSESDVNAWLEVQKTLLLAEVKKGPVLVN
jgi:hypothetical protein